MVNQAIQHLWTPIATMPLVWLVVTFACYVVGRGMQRACGGSVFASPVLVAIVIVATAILATGTDYKTYFTGAQFINFLLGPATVALAVPLARNVRLIGKNLHSIGPALLAGSLTSIVGGIGLVWLFHGSRMVALSMAPKAVTTPIAVAVFEQIGGIPALTAALAILGGILAAAVGQHTLYGLRITDWRAHGLAAGLAGSAVAAARVATQNELAAAFAALGIGLNGLPTAMLAPMLVTLWH
jgi:putative effector of murein hydrolase